MDQDNNRVWGESHLQAAAAFCCKLTRATGLQQNKTIYLSIWASESSNTRVPLIKPLSYEEAGCNVFRAQWQQVPWESEPSQLHCPLLGPATCFLTAQSAVSALLPLHLFYGSPLRHLTAKCLHPPRPYYSVSFLSRSVTRPCTPPPHSFVLIASVMLWKCPGQWLCGKLPCIEPLQGSVYCITGRLAEAFV